MTNPGLNKLSKRLNIVLMYRTDRLYRNWIYNLDLCTPNINCY